MSSKDATNNLAIIGASGTGKTTLAVGLYATSTKTFTVSPKGDETRKYLEARKTSIEEGFWPAATIESENFDLCLGLHTAGKETDIVFREYMGERMEKDPNYIREVIGKPKSAMVLFNPGMSGLDKPETRNRMLGNLMKIAQHLKENDCIAVAFVVTASDRLSSDLKAFREDFESYASEVTNHLTNLGLDWKRFDVTVSGQLDDQNKPRLARGENNTTHEPFLWLLACIKHHEFWRCIKVSAATAAVLLAVAGAAFGGFVWSSRSKLAGAEASLRKCLGALKASYASYDEAAIRTNAKFLETNAFERLSAILPSDRVRKDKVVAQAKEQRDLWNVRLLATEFALTSKKLKEKPADVQLGWFRDFDGKLTTSSPSFADAVSERGELADAWEKSRKALETVCQTAHFRNEVERESKNLASAKENSLVEPLKASFLLLMDTGDRYALVTNRSELSASLLPARTNAIARYIDSETVWEPTDPNPPGDAKDLIRKIRQELKSALSTDEFANLETNVEQRRNEARIAWEKHQFPRRRQAQLDELKGASDSPAISSALKDSLSFLGDLDRLFPSIPEPDRVSARAAITNERALAIGRYIDSKTRCKPEDDDPPGSVGELHLDARKDLKGALTTQEFDSLESKLTQRRDTARRAWDAHHFAQRASELETALKDAGAKPAKPLKESLAFLGSMTNDYPTISQADFIRTRASLVQVRNAALSAYGNFIADNWDVNGRKPPEFDGKKIRDTILTDAVVTDEEATAFDRDMEDRFAKANEGWKAVQKDRCDSFVREKLSSMPDVSDALSAYMDFRQDNSKNPFVENVDSAMTKRLEDRIEWLVKEYHKEFRSENAVWGVDANRSMRMQKAQNEFNELKRLCFAITNPMLDGTPVRHSWASKFALLCIEKGGLKESGINSAFQQRFEMTKILVKVDFESTDSTFIGLSLGAEIKTRFWQEGAKDSMSETLVNVSNRGWTVPKGEGGKWYSLWEGPRTFIINPWTDSYFTILWEDRVDIGFNVKGAFSRNIWSEFRNGKEYKDGYLEYTGGFHGEHEGPDTEGTITVRLYGRFTGVDLSMLLQQSQL